MLKHLFKNRPFQNFFFISLFQGVNFVALIIFIPFITKKIGVEKFGLVTVMQAICSFFYVLVDYGFSVTTVRQISVLRHNAEKLELIIKNTIGVKLLLLIYCIPIIFNCSNFFLKTHYDLNIVLLSFVAVVGQAAFPTWLCQGLEENKIAFCANLLSKTLLCLFIYSFIRTHEHYSYYLFFMGGANLVTGVLLTLYIFKYSLKFNLKFIIPKKRNIITSLRFTENYLINNTYRMIL